MLVEMIERIPDGRVIEYGGAQRWAEADRSHASDLMRWAYEHPGDMRRIGAAIGRRVRAEFESGRVCRQLAESIVAATEP
jgi:hypothetical protein